MAFAAFLRQTYCRGARSLGAMDRGSPICFYLQLVIWLDL